MANHIDRRPRWGAVLYPKLSDLWMTGYGCDVTIICQDGTMNVPSLLLSSISSKIHEILLLSKDKVLTFTNIDIQFWEDLISWVYVGVLPDHLRDGNLLPKLCSTLLVAHSLGMYEVLQLYKNSSQLGILGTSGDDIWKSFDPDVGLEVEVEYLNSIDESVTQVTFTRSILSDLKEYLQVMPVKTLKSLKKCRALGIEICKECSENCQSSLVQCVYCREILNKNEGMRHMQEKHSYCKSGIWPFSCNINYDLNQGIVKGYKALVKKRTGFHHYVCKLCRFSTEELNEFIEHFPIHGFFPQLCPNCGDVFSDEQLKDEHKEFCQIDTSQNEGNVDSEDDNDIMADIDDVENSSVDLSEMHQIGYEYQMNIRLPKVEKGSAKKCMACGTKCTAARVVCLYCNNIVSNDDVHMKSEHAHNKKAKVWYYTCNLERDVNTKEIVHKLANQHGEVLYDCNICNEKFANKERVFFHMKTNHKISSLFHCGHCDSGFKTSESRSIHEHICGGGSLVKCKKCEYFNSRENLRLHKIQAHENTGLKRKYTDGKLAGLVGTNSICFSCQKDCEALKVKCVYCFKIVDNDPSHMDLFHPYTPKTSRWVYSCNFLNRKVGQKEWLLFVKERKAPDEDTPQYRCLKCNIIKENLDDIKQHIKRSHQRYMKICKFCQNGFTSFVHHKDHEHFCGGGGLIACNICDRNVGCFRSLFDHMGKHHSEVEKITGKITGTDISLPAREVNEEDSPDDTMEADVFENEDPLLEDINNEVSDQLVCLSTGRKCNAHKVRCIYCCKETENTLAHLKSCPLTPPDVEKLVHVCKVSQGDWLVSVKEPIDEEDSEFDGSGSKQSQFRCIECNTVFTNMKGITNHLLDEHQITVKICEMCDAGFGKQELMEDHFHFCSGNTLLSCDLCERVTGSERLHKLHMGDIHSNKENLNENITAASISKEKNIPNQEYISPLYKFTDSSERRGICFKCGDTCKSSFVKCMLCYKFVENNSCHMDTQHTFTPKTTPWVYSCDMLEDSQNWMASFKEASLRIGQKGDDNEMTSQHHCCYCDTCLPELDSMLEHIKVDHGISHPVKVCDICDAVFLKFSYWKDHYHFCSGGNLLMCDTCGKELGGYRALANHKCPKLPLKMKQSKSFYESGEKIDSKPDEECETLPIKLEKESTELEDDNEEDYDMKEIEHIFVEEKTAQAISNPKRCFTCGDKCEAIMVECMFCNDVVFSQDNHMVKSHSWMPSNIIWPVNCTDVSGEAVSPIVTDMFLKNTENGGNIDLKVYRCLLCEEYCDTSHELSDHTEKSHGFRVTFCKICDAGFKCTLDRNSHQQFCCGGDLLKCSLCNTLVGNWVSAKTHYTELHKVVNESQMKRKAESEGSPRKKVKLAIEEQKENKCDTNPVSKKRASTSIQLDHLHELEIPKGIVLYCLECKFKTPSLFEINSHNEKHHAYNSNELGQICHFCFQLFKSRSKREKHEQHEHLNDQRVFCELCGRDFEIPLQKEIHFKYFHKNAR